MHDMYDRIFCICYNHDHDDTSAHYEAKKCGLRHDIDGDNLYGNNILS